MAASDKQLKLKKIPHISTLWLYHIIYMASSILSYVDGITYVHKANVYNHVKAGGLHDWAKKKFVMDLQFEYGCVLTESEAAT